jgi:hypothetical protein
VVVERRVIAPALPPIDAFRFAPVIFLLAPAEASRSSSASPSVVAAVMALIF